MLQCAAFKLSSRHIWLWLRHGGGIGDDIFGENHQVVCFGAAWAIDSRGDFRCASRAMITHAISEGHGAGES
jgi:hypothetical protein